MKILFICSYYHRAMIFRDSMDYLGKMGHSVTAFNAVCKNTRVDDKYKAIMDEKVIHKECFNKYDRFFFKHKQNKILKAIDENVSVKDFDLIHSHTLFNGGWAAYLLHQKYGIPYVVSFRNTDLNVFMKIPGFKNIARKIVNDASGVLFLSEAYRDKLLETCYKQEDRSSVIEKSAIIPNGLEPFWLENTYSPRISVHDPIELLCVGKIDKNKNLDTTVKVLEKLNTNGTPAHLTVIGQVIDKQTKTLLDGNERISVIPYLKKEDLLDYYRNSDIFIMPSFFESFGRVYAEAMTQGVPVIYTRGQGFDKNFPEGVVGYSVKADDVEEITDAVNKILNNYAEISKNCIENSRIFNWNDIAEQLDKLYSDSVAGGKI